MIYIYNDTCENMSIKIQTKHPLYTHSRFHLDKNALRCSNT